MNWDWDKLQERKERQFKGKGGGSSGPTPPNFDELKDKFKNFRASGIKLIIAILVLLWLASGFYIVKPDEVGVVQRFGAFSTITQSGPHYHFPYPIETVQTPSVTEIKRLEIGFRSSDYETSMGPQSSFRTVPKESLMLTGDENIVDVQFIVQYRIKEAENYLFNISQPRKTVKDAAEAAMRAVIGDNAIEAALTTEKFAIQSRTKELLQRILDSYKSGILVTAVKLQEVHPPQQVIDSFKDVASAREDKSRFINQANAYRNDIIPTARGRVAELLNEAEAYKETKIRAAKGETARFIKVLKEYRKASKVTKERLYLETMQEVLAKAKDKRIFSEKAGERIIPYLPMQELSGKGLDSAKKSSGRGRNN